MPFSIWILNETHRQSFPIVYTNQILKPNTTGFYIFYYFIICMKYIYINWPWFIYLFFKIQLSAKMFIGASSYIDRI
jgi:hypothetical protein